MRQWQLASPPKAAVELLCQTQIPPLVAHLLAVRGVTDPQAARDFLDGKELLADPFLLKDMDKAVARIQEALEEGQKICIYGDYDCDGITSTVLLYTYLQNVGADVFFYIPDRDQEGYGMNMGALSAIASKGTQLVITVDNGISAINEIAYAVRLGMDVVVTDHHQPREELPDCTAVVNPHRRDQDEVFRELAGVGVAFKLVCALEQDDGGEMLEYYSDLVALGTVADVVALQGENRCIVRHGLESLRHTQNVGLAALISACGLAEKALTATSIAFVLAPRINAAGRLGRVEKAMDLLLCEEEEAAVVLVEEICGYNKERQALEAAILKDVAIYIQKNPELLYQRVLLIAGQGWHPGVIGIVCARVVEKFGKPCILFCEEEGELRGSGRSVDGFDLIGCISRCHELLDQYGGHPAAAGLSLQQEQYEVFCTQMQQAAAQMYEYMPQAQLQIDRSVSVQEVTVPVLKALQVLEPFGASNEPPVFLYEQCRLEGIYVMGAGKHLRLKLSQKEKPFYAVYFNMPPESFHYQIGETVDIAANCDIGVYQGQEQLSVKIKDIRLSNFEQDGYFEGREQYDRFYRGEAFLEDSATRSIPDRASIAELYRALRDRSPFSGDYEGLFARVGAKQENYCSFRLGLEILEERGLVKITREKRGFCFSVAPVKGKTDLEQSPIMKKLHQIKEVN
ncbi:MAG: single-stranded-DNA-specific exonuclease RecJ [Oscillospiraceae bacterium]|nr:single-stranded-DNA-specific exonuclease RecJ [Oscillospiraceae bacterium]